MKYDVIVRYFILSEALNNRIFSYKEMTISIPIDDVTDEMKNINGSIIELNEQFWNMVKNIVEKEVGDKIELARGCYYILK